MNSAKVESLVRNRLDESGKAAILQFLVAMLVRSLVQRANPKSDNGPNDSKDKRDRDGFKPVSPDRRFFLMKDRRQG